MPSEGSVTGDGASGQPNLGLVYTADLSDEELARRWKESPESLGSISIGFVDEGPPRSFTPMTERTAPRSRDARNDREQLDEEPLRWTRTS